MGRLRCDGPSKAHGSSRLVAWSQAVTTLSIGNIHVPTDVPQPTVNGVYRSERINRVLGWTNDIATSLDPPSTVLHSPARPG
jgi:hypothetical protein